MLPQGEVFLASADRVAVDAVGLAVLKFLGSNPAIMKPKIFEQEQIAQAVELGLGASSPEAIELIAADEKSREVRDQIWQVLQQGVRRNTAGASGILSGIRVGAVGTGQRPTRREGCFPGLRRLRG